MSRLVIGSRAALIAALRAQEAPLAAAEAAERAAAAADAVALVAAHAAHVAALRAAFDAEVAAAQSVVDARVAARAAAAEAVAAPLAARREPLAERRREVAEELFLDALFLVAQFPGGQIAEADKCCYAYDVRACAGLCKATWAEEAFWSGLVRVRAGPKERTRLMYAAAHGDAARVSWLLARGAPREAKDVKGWTALYWASSKDRADAVRTLLTAGANVDAATNATTPLYIAAAYGHTDVMRMLLDAGANVEGTPYPYQIFGPLYVASMYGQVAAATLLLDAGADVNSLTISGVSPLARAKTPEMRALLVARGGVRGARAA